MQDSRAAGGSSVDAKRIDVVASIPFFLMHLMPLGIFWTGMTLTNALLCVGLYVVRMFFITAGYHRYFAHRAYKLNRFWQFVMAFGGGTAVQKGALWWAAHHRDHHRYSDTELDVHSPKHGAFWSHVGWILSTRFHHTSFERIKDFARFPELVWLNKHHWVPGALLGTACFLLGGAGALFAFFLSTVLLYHGTFTINSLAHVFGRRRYETTDTSRNSFLLALITLGEGWHNNHHHYQASANQGFFWWEIDISYYVIRAMAWLGIARDVRVAPRHVVLGTSKSARTARDGAGAPEPAASLPEPAAPVAPLAEPATLGVPTPAE